MNLSDFYTPLIFIAIITFVVNLFYKKHSKVVYLICAAVIIFGFSLQYFQSNHGTETIGGFFENQKEYEARYKIDITPDGESNTQKNIVAAIQRPEPTCSFLRLKCTRETLLVTVYTQPRVTEFDPSYCMLNLEDKTFCIDNHAKTWNVNLLSKIPQ